MFKAIGILITLFGLFGLNGGQILQAGQCESNLQVQSFFQSERFLGPWYEISRTPNDFQNGECSILEFSTTLVDDTYAAFNSFVTNNFPGQHNGVATFNVTDNAAKLKLNVTSIINAEIHYWVLYTDYTSFALTYSCQNINTTTRSINLWKLGRASAYFSNSTDQLMNERILTLFGVSASEVLVNVDQSARACYKLPVIEAGQSIVIPGYCDESIAGVQNFDANRFQGRWHQISSYYTPNSIGGCVEANYALNANGTVSVQNSQIINQELFTINGVAVVASNDSSGVLNVTLEVAQNVFVESPLKILATDYDHYAISYSCLNQENPISGLPERQVVSWILSRDKELSVSSAAAIAEVIDTVIDLNDEYYLSTNQSDAACFYYPDFAEGEPVVLSGSCESVNIEAISVFNVVSFRGRWHQVSSYHTSNNAGSCVKADYGFFLNGTVSIQNSQVINQTLLTINGVAIYANDDGSGALNATLEIAPNVFLEAPLKILATDYNSYAISYSCINRQNPITGLPERQVVSWILGRNRELSVTAAAAVSRVIDSVIDLNDKYYIPTDQSDAACFFYPEMVEGQSVVLPGSCDSVDIKGVSNFNAVTFQGRWHQISSYYTPNSIGSCVEANYALNANGTVSVLNSQVINQALLTIDGVAVVASNDGSGVLNVTLEVAPNVFVESPLKILATDYDNYTISYSCVDRQNSITGSPERQVVSWILSRDKELSEASAAAIAEVIDTVIDLNDKYYITTNQSEAACFYYPEIAESEPVVIPGSCDLGSLSGIPNFNIEQFATGVWYENARFPMGSQDGECTSSEVTISNQTLTFRRTNVYNGQLIEFTGSIIASSNGLLTITFLNSLGIQRVSSLFVLGTDYNNYALLYGCSDVDENSKQIYSWKLSRSNTGLSGEANQVIDAIVYEKDDLYEGYYKYTDFSNDACFYYPEYNDLNTPVILPGPCDDTIRGVANFNVEKYLGRWIELARYPQEVESSKCARATYTAADNGAQVINEFVSNQTLDTTVGSAVVASTDNSGLLSVTFEEDELSFVSSYYVLGTDYDNYALVYSCADLNGNQRRVSSWKLSRSKDLGAEYTSVMDDIIRNTQGLKESYYRPTSQTDEDCFYVPELDKEKEVRIRGQCKNVTGVQGFNAQMFAGWWHEIESYPTGANVGVCISSDIQSSENQYLVIDTNVFNLASEVSFSTLEVSNDGRLTRVQNNGETSTIWVLATDYDNYALLYSCENVDDEYVRVWSAKHSKTRQLSEASISAMAPVIEENQYLYTHLYVPVDQSDDACFHYPEISGPVVLPGQCDENIPVEPNFDVVRYTGTWYQVEKYDQLFERGTCGAARYTLSEEAGVVDVLNYQVVNGELEEINGTATVTSTDGSAKLNVNLLVGGQVLSTGLNVLKTDYATYSLAYSCRNINNYQRAIGVWKLSRTRTMPASGNDAINEVINQRPELHQPYFVPVEQNENCLQPNSASLLSSSVLIVLATIVLSKLF